MADYTVYRSGQKMTFSITLDEKPQDTTQPQIPTDTERMPENGSYDEWYRYFAPFFGNGG